MDDVGGESEDSSTGNEESTEEETETKEAEDPTFGLG
jgi:hypothetical protein